MARESRPRLTPAVERHLRAFERSASKALQARAPSDPRAPGRKVTGRGRRRPGCDATLALCGRTSHDTLRQRMHAMRRPEARAMMPPRFVVGLAIAAGLFGAALAAQPVFRGDEIF